MAPAEPGVQAVVRVADARDAPAVARTLEAAFGPLRGQYTPAAYAATVPDAAAIAARMPGTRCWVAVVEGQVAGTVTARPAPAGLYVQSMAVDPSARGRGIGRQLMAETVAFARELGLPRLYLSTTPFLHDAIRLYAACGFVPVPREGPAELHGTPLRTMELRL